VEGEAGEGGDTAEQPAYPGQPGAYFDASLEAAGLYEVGGNETGGDAGPVAHGGDQVELLPGHLVISRRFLRDCGEGDPVSEVCEVEQNDGPHDPPSFWVYFIL